MKVFVVFESMYGNTHEIANAIADGLAPAGDVTVGSVGELTAGSIEGAELVVVGGPTHIHGMSRRSSRAAAAKGAKDDDDLHLEPHADGPGLREWFEELPDASAGALGLAFDTRIDKSALLVGSAAKAISKRLRRRHYASLADPESFFMDESGSTLKEGETDRARRWGAELARRLDAERGA